MKQKSQKERKNSDSYRGRLGNTLMKIRTERYKKIVKNDRRVAKKRKWRERERAREGEGEGQNGRDMT